MNILSLWSGICWLLWSNSADKRERAQNPNSNTVLSAALCSSTPNTCLSHLAINKWAVEGHWWRNPTQKGDTIIHLDYLFSGEPGDKVFPPDSLPSELLQHSPTGARQVDMPMSHHCALRQVERPRQFKLKIKLKIIIKKNTAKHLGHKSLKMVMLWIHYGGIWSLPIP